MDKEIREMMNLGFSRHQAEIAIGISNGTIPPGVDVVTPEEQALADQRRFELENGFTDMAQTTKSIVDEVIEEARESFERLSKE